MGLCLLITGVLYYFKDDIIKMVVDEVNKNLKTKVAVSNVDLSFWGTFPNLSVDFNNVFIQDPFEGSTERDTLLYSDQIRLKFNPIDIWNENYTVKRIDVKPGTLQVKVRKNGEVNYDILKSNADTTASPFSMNLKHVAVEDLRFAYNNKATNQYYKAKINDLSLKGSFSDKAFDLETESHLFIQEARSGEVNLIRNQPAYLDVTLDVDKEKNLTKLPNAQIYIANLPFNINGKVSKGAFDFHLKANNLELDEVANRLSLSQLDEVEKFQGKGNVQFTLDISGKDDVTSRTLIESHFGVKNGELIEPVLGTKISKLQVQGHYSNLDGVKKEFLELSELSFYTNGGPFKGHLRITDFAAPRYEGNANGNIDLAVLHSLFPLPTIASLNGQVNVNSDFIVQALVSDLGTDYKVAKCEGEANLNAVNFQRIDDQKVFENINGLVFLRNDGAGIKDLKVKIASTDLRLNGVFTNLIPFFRGEGNLRADLDIDSRRIKVEDFATVSKEDKMEEARMYVLPANLEGALTLSIDKLTYADQTFSSITGLLEMRERQLNFSALNFVNAGSKINGSIAIREQQPEMFQTSAQLSTDRLAFKPLFREWKNFKQEVIKEDNIDGQMAVNLSFEAPFDLRYGIVPKAIKSRIDLKITNGRLKNVETFRTITESLKTASGKLALGKENIARLEKKLLNLEFATMENTLIIENGVLKIPEMTIRSSALDLDALGTHTFDNDVDYRFAFRFRDLKQSKEEEFGEVVDDGTGIRIFMRMYGPLDNPNFEWDKESKKEQRKEDIEQEKQDIKSMLKSEFGVFKKDSTIHEYKKKEEPKDEIKVIIGPEVNSFNPEEEKKKRDTKIKKTLDAWKKEAENKNKTEFEIQN